VQISQVPENRNAHYTVPKTVPRQTATWAGELILSFLWSCLEGWLFQYNMSSLFSCNLLMSIPWKLMDLGLRTRTAWLSQFSRNAPIEEMFTLTASCLQDDAQNLRHRTASSRYTSEFDPSSFNRCISRKEISRFGNGINISGPLYLGVLKLYPL
jgi:hypothetical protein